MRFYFLIFLTLFSCSPSSPKDFRVEGETHCKQLISILEKIETREDLLAAETLLKKKFNQIVTLVVTAEKYLEKNPGAKGIGPNDKIIYSNGKNIDINKLSASQYYHYDNDDLNYELKRIRRISGAKEILERIQKQPLIRLDQSETQKGSSALSGSYDR